MVSWRAESKARAVTRGKMIRWVGEGKRRDTANFKEHIPC